MGGNGYKMDKMSFGHDQFPKQNSHFVANPHCELGALNKLHKMQQLRFNSAFVTGGSGFVGRRLIRELVGLNVRVRALARSPQAIQTVQALGAEPVQGICRLMLQFHALLT